MVSVIWINEKCADIESSILRKRLIVAWIVQIIKVTVVNTQTFEQLAPAKSFLHTQDWVSLSK